MNELAEKAYTWTRLSAIDSTNRSRPIGIYYLREEDSLKAKLEDLTRVLETLKTKDSRVTCMVASVETQTTCFFYRGVEHPAQDCPTYGEIRGIYDEQFNHLRNV